MTKGFYEIFFCKIQLQIKTMTTTGLNGKLTDSNVAKKLTYSKLEKYFNYNIEK